MTGSIPYFAINKIKSTELKDFQDWWYVSITNACSYYHDDGYDISTNHMYSYYYV